ncbi:Predicted transcriptional regulator [uncultured Desulfobacterium sp.]|uniref:Predicted transcriptional regulator n=1 Tax=uncultured Desulfobacterium sp. TaxID=201089 RepID=A0A445MSN5_9BACT|nr:Predicted transcriptional regulator [uncultured Desulfobacterium sp.]
MKLRSFFRTHPVFTIEEFTGFLSSDGTYNIRTRESLLDYHVKAGNIVRVRRGLYASVPAEASPENFPLDPFLLAGRLAKDAILAYHTALEAHGKAYSVYERFTYLASKPMRLITFRSHLFKGTRFPKALVRNNAESFDVMQTDRSGMEIRITGLERTLVDVLNRPDLSGSWEEIWRSLETIEYFDLDKVTQYTLLLENATTAAKVGFFLDQHRESLMVEDTHLKAFHDLRPRRPHYMERSRRKFGRLVSAWNLVAPEEILYRSWEESL